ncbi:predicted protein, partial [Nematostella vectensis]
MADKLQWLVNLPEHPLFKELSRSRGKRAEASISRNVVVERDGEIFVWSPSRSHVLTANLKNLKFENERATKFQTLLCTTAPVFNVSSLQFSITGKYLALIGERGITVLEVPQRWGRFAEYEGGSDTVNCRTILVDERFFSTHHKAMVLQASWHPESPVDGHLVVLTSDNRLRIYNILKPDTPEQIINLADPLSTEENYNRSTMSSASAFAIAFGETSVAFDFAPPVTIPAQKSLLASRSGQDETIHPVFVLRENADVYYLTFQLGKKGGLLDMAGPLTMHPAAFDNYGLDACALVCLHSMPPVVAMATANGRVYNCIVLESNDDDSADDEDRWSDKGATTTTSSELTLYVHECIELQRSVAGRSDDGVSSVSGENDSTECVNSCPVKLYKDPGSLSQYHCSHLSGVHTVTLSWLSKLQKYVNEGTAGNTVFDIEDEAVVSYMVCTTPAVDSAPLPVNGLCTISDPLLGHALICITADMECAARSNLKDSVVIVQKPCLCLYSQYMRKLSPMRHLYTGSFFAHIQRILERQSSAPLLRADKSSAPLSQKDFLEILTEAQQNLREEYIQKQTRAREEIVKRVSILEDQRVKQLQDLGSLREKGNHMRETTEALAERLYEVSTKEEELQQRIDRVRELVQTYIPVLSDAEKEMKDELESYKIQMVFLQDTLNKV